MHWHDAVAIVDENMTVGIVRSGNDFKLPPIERMGRIGYFENERARAIWVVEGGSNIGYRSTASHMRS